MQLPPALESFIEACVPLAERRDHQAVQKLLAELITSDTFAADVPQFDEVETSPLGWRLGGEHICHQTDGLTIMVLDTLPGVLQPPHDHSMNAIIGVFEGCEEQRFFAHGDDGVTPAAGRTLEAGDAIVLGERAIHAISAPEGRPARAVHVYFGDIYGAERSIYHPDTLEPQPYSAAAYDEFCRAAT